MNSLYIGVRRGPIYCLVQLAHKCKNTWRFYTCFSSFRCANCVHNIQWAGAPPSSTRNLVRRFSAAYDNIYANATCTTKSGFQQIKKIFLDLFQSGSLFYESRKILLVKNQAPDGKELFHVKSRWVLLQFWGKKMENWHFCNFPYIAAYFTCFESIFWYRTTRRDNGYVS